MNFEIKHFYGDLKRRTCKMLFHSFSWLFCRSQCIKQNVISEFNEKDPRKYVYPSKISSKTEIKPIFTEQTRVYLQSQLLNFNTYLRCRQNFQFHFMFYVCLIEIKQKLSNRN